ADRERGGTTGDRQLVVARRGTARPGRGDAPRVRVPLHRAPRARSDREAGHDVRVAAAAAGPAGGGVPVPGVGDASRGARARRRRRRPLRRTPVRILHTSDWHVGKTIRGEPRLAEHVAVLAEIAETAAAEAVDLIVVAGDLYESAAPSAEAEAVVTQGLLALRTVAPVVAIAGNHDNPARFEAVRPLAAAAGIEVRGRVAKPDEGGVVTMDTADGERARIALLPFCSPRYSVRAAQLMDLDAAAAAGEYADRLAAIVDALCAHPDPGAVNLLVAHCMVRGGMTGGGERDAQTAFEPYWLSAAAFPPSLA